MVRSRGEGSLVPPGNAALLLALPDSPTRVFHFQLSTQQAARLHAPALPRYCTNSCAAKVGVEMCSWCCEWVEGDRNARPSSRASRRVWKGLDVHT